MYKYSLVLLAASAVLFSGCGEGECCQNINAPIAVIESGALNSGTLSGVGSRDTNADGSIVSYKWTVDGNNVDATYTLPDGTHEVCLTVTDNDGLTNSTCKSVTIDPATNAKPVATVNAPATCIADSNINISGSGTDDGSIASYNWTPDTIMGQTGAITCPSSGSTQVCLTVTDNEGLASDEVCKTITVEVPTTKPPIITIGIGDADPDGRKFLCGDIRDDDAIHTIPGTYLYGSNTPKDIKEVTWVYTYFLADGSIEDGPNTKTQGEYNANPANAQSPGECIKWFHTNNGVATIELNVTAEDDDGETSFKSYLYTKATNELVEQ